jgi:hypothetical protein
VSAYMCGRSSACYRLTTQSVTQTESACWAALGGQPIVPQPIIGQVLVAKAVIGQRYWPFEVKMVKGNSRARVSTCFPCERAQQKRSVV